MYQSAKFKKKLSQCNNLSNVRKLLDEDPEKNNQLLKESCKLIITLMKGIFSGLKLNNNNLEPRDTIEDNINSEFFSGLKLDKNWHDMKLLNHYLICHYYQHILNIHVKSKSIFSVKKCGINNCSSYFAPQLPPDMFSTLIPSTRPWNKWNQWRPLQNIWQNLWYQNMRNISAIKHYHQKIAWYTF